METKLTPADKKLISAWIDSHYGEVIQFFDHRESLESLILSVVNLRSGNKALDEALNEGDGTYRP